MKEAMEKKEKDALAGIVFALCSYDVQLVVVQDQPVRPNKVPKLSSPFVPTDLHFEALHSGAGA